MNSAPITVRSEAFSGTGIELLEHIRRQLNLLIQRDALTGENGAYTASGATIATTTSKVKTVNTTNYTVGGAWKTKAATDNLWTLTGTVVPFSSYQKYLLMLDGSGVASVVECQMSTPANSAGTALASLVKLPSYATFQVACIASITVSTNGSTAFTPGTTALNAAGITTTYQDGFDTTLAQGSLIQTFDPTGQG